MRNLFYPGVYITQDLAKEGRDRRRELTRISRTSIGLLKMDRWHPGNSNPEFDKIENFGRLFIELMNWFESVPNIRLFQWLFSCEMEQGIIRNKQGLYDWLKMAKLPYDNFIIIFIINPKNSL